MVIRVACEEDAPVNPTPPPFSSAPPAGEVIVRTEQLTKRFGARVAVNALTLEVRRGDVFGLLGPNGAGKSTTLRMLLGLTWPTAGTFTLFGKRIDDDVTRRATLRRVGSIIEQPSFYPYLTGRENLRGVGVYAGIEDEHTLRLRVEEALFHVGLAPRGADVYRTYSLGLKQRLGVAAALLTNPELVILDEPTNGLDPSGMVEMRQLIQHLAAQGMTVILSSHLLHEVQQVCTRVAILKEGTVVAQGAVSELLATGRGIVLGFDQPQRSMQAVQVLQEAATNGAGWLRGARYVRPEPGAWTPPGGWLLQVEAPFERAPEVAYLLAARGIYPMEMRQREGSLEELFLALTSATPPQSTLPVAQVTAPQPVAVPQPAGAAQADAVAEPSMTAAPPGAVAQPAIPAPSMIAPQAAVMPQTAPAESVQSLESFQPLEPAQSLKSAPEDALPPPDDPDAPEPQPKAAPVVSPTPTIPLHPRGEGTSRTPASGSSGESGGDA